MGKNLGFKPLMLVLIITVLLVSTILLARGDNQNNVYAADIQPNDPKFDNLDDLSEADNSLANCRYGMTSAETTAHAVPRTGAGVFYKFNQPNWFGPLPDNDAELLHMIKTRQRKNSSGDYLSDWYIQGYSVGEELAGFIRNDPGAIWIVGNEIERGPNPGETWSARTGDMYPDIYAEAYHDLYHFIKGVDPTARVANAGLIQITPMRLQYLEKMWDAYQLKYGEDMPVDVWTIHTYVLPELTADGEPNNIASAALATDVTLGKRDSGGDGSICSDDMVYCHAEHDDISILKDQIVAMRQWMKNHGQQNKPLIITEYGTLYHYIIKENGSCGGLRDEFGNCFIPERVTKFMLDSFQYLNYEGRDPNLGLPSDNNRLVQQWVWYGAWEWDIGSSNLLEEWNGMEFSMMGKKFRDHIQAEQPYVNLVVDEVDSTVIEYDENETATAQISVKFRNNGNVSIEDPFKVTFYSDSDLTQIIGERYFSNGVRGCATQVFEAQLDWGDLPKGIHDFWVKVDSDNIISEVPSNNDDNIGSGQVKATGPVYSLNITIENDGVGQGGVVTTDPDEITHTEGTEVKLTAIPFAGWTFEGWSGAVVGNSQTVYITMLEDTEITAHFKQIHYTVEVNFEGSGTVKIDPDQDYFVFGEYIKINPIADEGWQFASWEGSIEETKPVLLFPVEGDINLTAVFTKVFANSYLPVIEQ